MLHDFLPCLCVALNAAASHALSLSLLVKCCSCYLSLFLASHQMHRPEEPMHHFAHQNAQTSPMVMSGFHVILMYRIITYGDA